MAATIRIDILGDSRSAQRSARDASRGYDRLGRDMDRTGRKAGTLGKSLGAAARRYGPLAALAAGGAVLKIGSDSITAASRVEQSFGAIDAVFGRNARAVKRWAKNAVNSVGLSKSAYAELATVAGAMLKNTGIEDYASQTKGLIKLGADLAAQYGGTTKTAMESISSLLRGEMDPIEKYGVSIKQIDINAALAAKGLDKLTGNARKEAEQQARLKLLYDQTADAQGAFTRESGTFAQAQQKLGANWDNISAKLGEKFLPVAARFTTWLSNTITGTSGTGKALRRLGEMYTSFITPVIDGAVEGWQRFNKKLDEAYGGSDTLKKGLQKLVGWVEKEAPKLGRYLGKELSDLGEDAATTAIAIEKIVTGIKDLIKWADEAMGPVDELAVKLGKLGNFSLPGIGQLQDLVGLFSSGDPLPGGLGRAGGLGAIGGSGGGMSVTMRPEFVIHIGNKVLEKSQYRIAQRVARDEISTQVRAARGTR